MAYPGSLVHSNLMTRTEQAIAAYLAGDLIAVRAAFGVSGSEGTYALDGEGPGSEATIAAYDPEGPTCNPDRQ